MSGVRRRVGIGGRILVGGRPNVVIGIAGTRVLMAAEDGAVSTATIGAGYDGAVPSGRTFYRLFGTLPHGRHVTGSASTRRSLAARPKGAFGSLAVAARPRSSRWASPPDPAPLTRPPLVWTDWGAEASPSGWKLLDGSSSPTSCRAKQMPALLIRSGRMGT